jgi:guanine nucleotide-binding protein G(i) subunit alpha
LTLFETIVNSSWFEKSAIILFLNKMDLFVAKLPSEPIERHVHGFPADRGLEPEYASKWLRQRFLDLNHNVSLALYATLCC